MKGSGSLEFAVKEMEDGRGVQPEGDEVGVLLGADEDGEDELLEETGGKVEEEVDTGLLLLLGGGAVPGRH